MNKLEKVLVSIESNSAFGIPWYSIFVNPFYITRRQILLSVQNLSRMVPPNSRVLDVGCGTKPYEKLFRTKQYIGIDIKNENRHGQKNVDEFFDGLKIPYKDGTFDVVFTTEVLEHTQYPEKLLDEMKRVLKRGGILFVSMPFVWPEHGTPFDFQRYTSFKHEQLLSKLNLKKISINHTTGVFGTCGQLLSDFYFGWISKAIFESKLRYGVQFILFRIVTFFLCFPTQFMFECADILVGRKGITLDFIIVAQKK